MFSQDDKMMTKRESKIAHIAEKGSNPPMILPEAFDFSKMKTLSQFTKFPIKVWLVPNLHRTCHLTSVQQQMRERAIPMYQIYYTYLIQRENSTEGKRRSGLTRKTWCRNSLHNLAQRRHQRQPKSKRTPRTVPMLVVAMTFDRMYLRRHHYYWTPPSPKFCIKFHQLVTLWTSCTFTSCYPIVFIFFIIYLITSVIETLLTSKWSGVSPGLGFSFLRIPSRFIHISKKKEENALPTELKTTNNMSESASWFAKSKNPSPTTIRCH